MITVITCFTGNIFHTQVEAPNLGPVIFNRVISAVMFVLVLVVVLYFFFKFVGGDVGFVR
jgi:hypothetical protein